MTFDDAVNTTIPVGPLEDNLYTVANAVHEMRARGETALYDAIKTAIEMTDMVDGEENAIRAVVVLTDGWANHGQVELDDLVNLLEEFSKYF